jgi:hypothetical protein
MRIKLGSENGNKIQFSRQRKTQNNDNEIQLNWLGVWKEN